MYFSGLHEKNGYSMAFTLLSQEKTVQIRNGFILQEKGFFGFCFLFEEKKQKSNLFGDSV